MIHVWTCEREEPFWQKLKVQFHVPSRLVSPPFILISLSSHSHSCLTFLTSSRAHLLISPLFLPSSLGTDGSSLSFQVHYLVILVNICLFFLFCQSLSSKSAVWAFQLSCHVYTWRLQLKNMSALGRCGLYNFTTLCRARRSLQHDGGRRRIKRMCVCVSKGSWWKRDLITRYSVLFYSRFKNVQLFLLPWRELPDLFSCNIKL